MLRSIFLGCTLWASVASVLVGAESMEHRYTPRTSGDAYVTCTITDHPLIPPLFGPNITVSETIYIPINMGGRCMRAPQSVTVGSFRVETLGSDKQFEIHVYNHLTGYEIETAAVIASVKEENGKKGKYSLRNMQNNEIITISYSFVDQRSREQKREDTGDARERFCVKEG